MFRKKGPQKAEQKPREFSDVSEIPIICDDPYLVQLIRKLERSHDNQKNEKNN